MTAIKHGVNPIPVHSGLGGAYYFRNTIMRSATLDTGLSEQVAFIQSMRNEKANSYWEAELPPIMKISPPQLV